MELLNNNPVLTFYVSYSWTRDDMAGFGCLTVSRYGELNANAIIELAEEIRKAGRNNTVIILNLVKINE